MKKLLPLVLVAVLVAFTAPSYAIDLGGALDYIFPPGANSLDMKIRSSKFVLDAEVTVTADLYLTYICKGFNPDSHAAASAFKCDLNAGNVYDPRLCHGNFDPVDSITNSFNSLTGIAQVNQATGYMNNQGNATAVAAVDKGQAYTKAEAVAQEVNTNNTIYDPGFNCDKIDNAFNQLKGLVQVNQSTGSMNNQNNAAAIAVGTNGMVALADAKLVQSNTGNKAYNAGFSSGTFFNQNSINNAFNNGTGAIQVNQSAGSMNNQANVLAVSAVR